MADLYVKEFDMANPFVVASSPATHGDKAVLKSAAALPGAVVMRNFGHGAGGGSYTPPSWKAMRAGEAAIQSHAVGMTRGDFFTTLEEYCEAIKRVRRDMPVDVKLWVSVGHYGDAVRPGVDWENDWIRQAKELQRAGADALELHFNTPGVAVARNRVYDFYRLIYNTTKSIKAVAGVPVMVKLPVEACDPLRAMEAALHGGADAVGPTARWKGFVIDIDWAESRSRAGGGYGGTQALPVACYTVAEARREGISLPMFAGGGVFSWDAAAKLLMAGSQAVQLGSLACCLGPRAVEGVIRGLGRWMDEAGYDGIPALCGAALKLFDPEVAQRRMQALGGAYKAAQVDKAKCTGCRNCVEACWYEGIAMAGDKAEKTKGCIGCGYCFQVCSTGALKVDAPEILKDAIKG